MQYACMLPCMTAGPSSTACTGPIPAVDAASTTLGELIDVEASAKFAAAPVTTMAFTSERECASRRQLKSALSTVDNLQHGYQARCEKLMSQARCLPRPSALCKLRQHPCRCM